MKIKKIFKKNVFWFIIFLFLAFITKDAKAFIHDYNYEGIAYYASTISTSENSPVYRFWSDQKQAHLYTISESEKNYVINTWPNDWNHEGIAYYASTISNSEKLPVYRFWSDQKQVHFYTISESEKNYVISNWSDTWSYDGIAYYASTISTAENFPVYRFWSECKQKHFYTISEAEKDSLLSTYEYCDPNPNLLGPEITVGLWSYTRDDLRDDYFKIYANKDYIVKNHAGTIIGTINKDERTKVQYDGDGKLRIYESINSTLSNEIVYFEAADGNNSDMIFNTNIPKYSGGIELDEYRGKIILDYSEYTDPDTKEFVKKIWVVNALPLEHYTWGDGELIGDGDMDHNRVMVTSFRTYGYWWIDVATKWRYIAGFIVNATPGNQLYKGYDYEESHPRVREAAEETRGIIVTSKHSDEKDRVAITPYSSWTDGKTRGMPDGHFNKQCKSYTGAVSDSFKWLKPVDDPYGKHPTLSTCELASLNNHMVGLSANGSVTLANDEGWSWTKILNYYFDDIDITSIY